MTPHADRHNAIHEELRDAVLGVLAAHGLREVYPEVRHISWDADRALSDVADVVLDHELEAERNAARRDVESA